MWGRTDQSNFFQVSPSNNYFRLYGTSGTIEYSAGALGFSNGGPWKWQFLADGVVVLDKKSATGVTMACGANTLANVDFGYNLVGSTVTLELSEGTNNQTVTVPAGATDLRLTGLPYEIAPVITTNRRYHHCVIYHAGLRREACVVVGEASGQLRFYMLDIASGSYGSGGFTTGQQVGLWSGATIIYSI